MTEWIESELNLLQGWIVEREAIRRAKEAGLPKPWTTNRLLRDYRWCNVRRMDDRVSQALINHWYPGVSERSTLTAAALARLINWPEALFEITGGGPYSDATLPIAREALRQRAARGDKVFTGAYVVPGSPGRAKVDSVMDLVEQVHDQAAGLLGQSMRDTWAALTRLDGLGSFLAGQIVADIAHLPAGAAWRDRDRWAPVGPGSARGLNRLRGIRKTAAVSQVEFERLLPELTAVLRPRIVTIWFDRHLQAMDLQNSLCEFDKMRRLQLQEGKVRARYDGGAPSPADDLQQSLSF